MSKVIFTGNPTLPHTFEYTPNRDSPQMLFFSGSAWTDTKDKKIGLKLSVNGSEVITTSIWSNGHSTHRALNPGLIMYTFPIAMNNGVVAPVTMKIEVAAHTRFDINDSVTIALL